MKNQITKFSIVTAVRNGEEFVEQTILSVINQDYSNFEYILIDGKSSDNTLAIAKKYEGRFACLLSERDEGISDAFNKGLSFVTGDYILILNADDRLAHQSVLADIEKLITENNFPVLIYGNAELVERHTDQKITDFSQVLSRDNLKLGKLIPHPCLFTHRNYFAQYGNFDLGFKLAMDYEWLLRGALKVPSFHAPYLTTKVRSGGMSAVNTDLSRSEILLALDKNSFFETKIERLKVHSYFKFRYIMKSIVNFFGLDGLLKRIQQQ